MAPQPPRCQRDGGSERLCDLAAVAVGIDEGRRPPSPRPVRRTGEQLDAALLQNRAHRVDVLDPDVSWNLEPASRLATAAGSTRCCAAETRSRLSNGWVC